MYMHIYAALVFARSSVRVCVPASIGTSCASARRCCDLLSPNLPVWVLALTPVGKAYLNFLAKLTWKYQWHGLHECISGVSMNAHAPSSDGFKLKFAFMADRRSPMQAGKFPETRALRARRPDVVIKETSRTRCQRVAVADACAAPGPASKSFPAQVFGSSSAEENSVGHLSAAL